MAARTTRHRTVAVDVDAPAPQQPRQWRMPWQLVAGGGAAAVVLAGWLVLAAFAAVGWLTTEQSDLAQALTLATRILLLAHGSAVEIGGLQVSIAPLGLTMLLIFLALPVASFAARLAAAAQTDPDDTGKLWVDGEVLMRRVGLTFAASYAATVLLLALLVSAVSVRLLIATAAISLIAGFWGASRGAGYDPTSAWPNWLRVVPRAMFGALLIVFAGASLVLLIALLSGRANVTSMVTSLEAGGAGEILLTALHLIYLPNFVLACASWALGAGITLGEGSLVTLVTTDLGLMPAIPILGAVPPVGLQSSAQLWWLSIGLVAGGVAGLIVVLARPRARFDETALTGGLAGVAAGLLVAVGCGVAGGGLGVERLAVIGARVPQLMIFAPSLLGLSGMLVGLILGLLRQPKPSLAAKPSESDPQPEAETGRLLG